MNTRDMTRAALLSAMICALAPYALPIGPISITLATFAVYLVAAVGGKRLGLSAVIMYILIGAVGVPVFAGFSGGLYKLVGATGGYILGYIPCAYVTAWFSDKYNAKPLALVVGMVLGTVVLYAMGTAWFMYITATPLVAALSACVTPFLFGDSIKIVLATAVAVPAKNKVIGKAKA